MNGVESGTDPVTVSITASKVSNGTTVLTPPLCPYPKYPRYKGSGATTDAANFVCAEPSSL
jgi:hypothetical protein